MGKIFVLGSINMDLVIRTDGMPHVGQCVRGRGFIQNAGGKGANQAIACAKLGAEAVYMLGAVGSDDYGKALAESLEKYHVDTSGLVKKDGRSGVCIIVFDERQRDNMLIVDTAANDELSFLDVRRCLDTYARKGACLIAQLEVPMGTVIEALKTAKQKAMTVILNPAPAVAVGGEVLQFVDWLIPNETEFEIISGYDCRSDGAIKKGCERLRGMGAKKVIITRGKTGSTYCDGETMFTVPSRKVEAVDTTAAGDTYIGAFALKLEKGSTVLEAMQYATLCASVTVGRIGAAQSIPTAKEIETLKILG